VTRIAFHTTALAASLPIALTFVLGCSDKKAPAPSEAQSSSGVAAPNAPSASTTRAAASPAASGTSAAEKGGADASLAGAYAGTYKAKVGTVSDYPKEAKVAAWEKDAGTEAVGDGTLSLVVTRGRRVVTGEAKGALGEQTLSGDLDATELRAKVDPKNPNTEPAMTGVLTGTFANGTFTGTLRVSGRNGNVVREAEIKLAKQ
jgi:hypothetical protein